MKVLKYGEGYPKTVTCGKCKSELEYTITDIQHAQDVEYTSDSLVDYQLLRVEYIVCPVCGQSVRTFSAPIWSIDSKKRKWWQV